MNHYHQASLAGHYDDDEALFVNGRSEEHTSELQSRCNLVCRLLLEKKKSNKARACAAFISAMDARGLAPSCTPGAVLVPPTKSFFYQLSAAPMHTPFSPPCSSTT